MTRDGTLSLVWLIDEMRDAEQVSLSALRASLSAVLPRYEIVIVTRAGDALSRHFTGADPYILVVVPTRSGEGAALTAGCAAMTGEYALIVVGAAVPDWAALPALVPFLERADIVASFHVPITREAKSRRAALTSATLAFLFGVTLRDPFNPAKLYRAELLRGLTFVSSGAALSLELLAKTRMQGAIVTEVGMPDARMTTDVSTPVATQWAEQAARLWLHLQVFRVPWAVRSQPTMRPTSVYAAWGVVLAAFVWFMRGWFVRVHDDR